MSINKFALKSVKFMSIYLFIMSLLTVDYYNTTQITYLLDLFCCLTLVCQIFEYLKHEPEIRLDKPIELYDSTNQTFETEYSNIRDSPESNCSSLTKERYWLLLFDAFTSMLLSVEQVQLDAPL